MAITVTDVTPEMLEKTAKNYLASTDWMVWKSVEDNIYNIPQYVIDMRAYARTLIDTTSHKAQVDDMRSEFYNVTDKDLAFKNLTVHKENLINPQV